MAARLQQPSFVAGEISPSMYGRVDQTKYHLAAAKMTNFLPEVHGGASNRGGFGFIDCVTNGWYFPFEFSVTQSYAILLGGATRFFTKTAFLQTGGAPVVVQTDIRDVAVYEWVLSGQGTDTWYVRAPGGGAPFVFCNAPAEVLENGNPVTKNEDLTDLSPGDWGWGDQDSLGFRTIYIRMNAGGNPNSQAANYIQTDVPYMFEHPYDLDDIPEVRHVQANDVMYMTHPAYKVQTLTRSGHTSWAFADAVFGPTIGPPIGFPGLVYNGGGAPARNIAYAYSVLDASGNESALSAANIVSVPQPWPDDGTVTITAGVEAGAVKYYFYKNVRGFYGWIGESATTNFIDDNILPDETFGPQIHISTRFQLPGDYPRACAIYQQRLLLAGTDLAPQTIDISQTGLFNNFGTSSPLRDTDAIRVAIASRRADIIEHLVPMGDILVMTSGAEWVLSSGSDSALTPFSVAFQLQGYRGCSVVIPEVVSNTVLYTQRHNEVVRDLTFALEENAFRGNDLTVLASHLLKGYNIRDMSYQQTPNSILWVIRDDGVLLSFTYMREQDIWAWAPHETQGEAISLTAISGSNRDDLYVLMKRNVGGQDVYYSEYLRDRLPDNDIKRAFLVDSGLSYSGPAVSSVSNLDHLIGQEVVALADGSVLRGLIVDSNGSIDLPEAAEEISVGLSYDSWLVSLPLDGSGQQGTIQGQKKKVTNVALRFNNTRGLHIGTQADNLTPIKMRTNENAGQPIDLYTGIKRVTINQRWVDDIQIFMHQPDPIPVTILSLLPEVVIGEQ